MNQPLLVIVGETGVGKSQLALEVAEKMNGEIICADSWTVRRGLNIGTDKPSKSDRLKINHHLIDIVDPTEDFTVAVYKDLALDRIKEINSRGRLPVLVGGSGLYIDSVIFNYGFLEEGDRSNRQELNGKSAEELLAICRQLGLSTDFIDTRNKRRLIRLIESGGAVPSKETLRDNTLVIGVSRDREELELLINKRVDQMVAYGLEDEVRGLVNKYGWDCEALRGVGYKQWRAYFEGGQSLQETKQQIVGATLNLAKKQRTWFKRNKSIHWFKQPVNVDDIVALATTSLSTNHFI